MTKKIKAGIVGATGYAGVELVRLLIDHKEAELAEVSSVSFHGKSIGDVYPGIRHRCSLILSENPEHMIETCDVIFASLPHGLSQELAEKVRSRGKKFIDLGADFRLEKEEEYRTWYGGNFLSPELHNEAVYGLSEIFREKIQNAELIANPGCYPTSAALGLYPALAYGLVEPDHIVIDSKSGVTGAGRSLTEGTHYPECNEAFSAYKAGKHRHRPEIEQILSKIYGKSIKITFTPHLLPVNRGILSTIYVTKKADWKQIRRAYQEAYEEEPFVQVLPEGEYANIKNVRMSNSCHISLHSDEHTDTLIICSAIDNMVKGAAGQAIQNMNLMFGFPEESGLSAITPAF